MPHLLRLADPQRRREAEVFIGQTSKTSAAFRQISFPRPRLPHPSFLPNAVVASFGAVPGHPWATGALVVLEAPLAHALVTSILSIPYLWPNPSRPAPQPVHEATAAFMLATGRRLGLVPDFQLQATGHRAWSEFSKTCHAYPHRVIAIDGRLQLGKHSYAWTVYLLLLPKPTMVPERFGPSDLLRLDGMPLGLNVVAAASWTRRSVVRALQPGAAWLPGDGWTITLEEHRPVGKVWLQSPRNTLGVEARLRADGALVLGEEVTVMQDSNQQHPATNESVDPQAASSAQPAMNLSQGVAQALADAPVLVRVELGTVSLTAEQWARVGPGTILTTGHPLAQHVVLRVGDMEVARGELVNVEGELGVSFLLRA
jgi:flagellar motor switch/type III secretory pathway protein FliN